MIPLGPDQFGLVIGDAMGSGSHAAPVMANVREAVHTCAGADGANPGSVICALDKLAAETGVGEMTTLIYVALDVHVGTLRLSNAGHCPPLVLDGNGDAVFVEGGRSVPLGTAPTTERPEADVWLKPGMTLVLYTDGLVETRARPLGDGLQNLRRAAANGPHSLGPLCDHVLVAMLGGHGQQDDVALLAVRISATVS